MGDIVQFCFLNLLKETGKVHVHVCTKSVFRYNFYNELILTEAQRVIMFFLSINGIKTIFLYSLNLTGHLSVFREQAEVKQRHSWFS